MLGGLTTLSLFTLHGATFLGLKADGEVRERARHSGLILAPATFALMLGFLSWTYVTAHTTHHNGLVPPFLPILGLVVLAGVGWLMREHLEGWAFVATALVIVILFVTLFLNLYPRVLVSSVSPKFSLTLSQAASQPYTLKVMSWVALIFTPFVLLYQSWTYWIFRKRVRRAEPLPTSSGIGS